LTIIKKKQKMGGATVNRCSTQDISCMSVSCRHQKNKKTKKQNNKTKTKNFFEWGGDECYIGWSNG